MTLNSSGPISLAGTTAGVSIEIENGGNGTTQISLNDAAVRSLAGVPSGAITMPTNFWGKSNTVTISYTFTSNTANASLAMSAISGYSAGKSIITITVNSGIYLYSTSTGSYGLNLTGGTTGDTVTLVNNGYIAGRGGDGAYNSNGGGGSGASGGPALNVGIGVNITINNTNASAYIAGGGGGGASCQGQSTSGPSGGGAGGGTGGGVSCYRPCCCLTLSANGGAGGNPGASGANGQQVSFMRGGGGGGRVFPGSGGASFLGGGAGGGGRNGPGGSSNNAATTPYGCGYGGGGGGWGASGAQCGYRYWSGGSGGKAVNLNGKSVTWVSGNTTRVWGTVS